MNEVLGAETIRPFGQWLTWTRIPNVTLRWAPLDAAPQLNTRWAAEDAVVAERDARESAAEAEALRADYLRPLLQGEQDAA